MRTDSKQIRRLAVTAVFLSAALVLKYLSSDFPLFGANGIRIGFAGIMSAMPAFLFGPFYGAVTAALTDFLGFYLSRQTAPYTPLITLTAALGGFLRGFLWKIFKDKKTRIIRVCVITTAFIAGAFGILNTLFVNADGITPAYYETGGTADTSGMSYISKLLIEGSVSRSNPTLFLSQYITLITVGLTGFAVFCLFLAAADYLISKKLEPIYGNLYTVQILTVMMLSGLTVNILNTVILREVIYTSWKLFPFAAVGLPRAAEEMISVTLYSYIVVVLYSLYQRYNPEPR